MLDRLQINGELTHQGPDDVMFPLQSGQRATFVRHAALVQQREETVLLLAEMRADGEPAKEFEERLEGAAVDLRILPRLLDHGLQAIEHSQDQVVLLVQTASSVHQGFLVCRAPHRLQAKAYRVSAARANAGYTERFPAALDKSTLGELIRGLDRVWRVCVSQAAEPLWRLIASQYRRPLDATLRRHVSAALASDALRMQRELLEPLGLRIDPEPALWKYLPGPALRLFLRVDGDSPAVEEGQVVAVVLLHDPQSDRTLYAHPIHAGARANPLLGHLHGPMATPKAQEGANGDRATLRLLEHKRAIWDQFLLEREQLEPHDAGRRWRERYSWALVRLYFCERCPGCGWGSPFFDGISGQPHRAPRTERSPAQITPGLTAGFFERLRESAAWAVETAYVRRGGLAVNHTPALAAWLDRDMVFAAFPTDVEFIDAGVPVGLALYADASTASVRHAHVLTAGPEPEPALLHGERALGLPRPQPGEADAAARDSYARWRARGWSQFWLRELEDGPYAASESWLTGYWDALARLFGLKP